MHRIYQFSPLDSKRISESWEAIGRIEDAVDPVAIKIILLETAALCGLSSLFAGWVPSLDPTPSRSQITARIVHDHDPCEWMSRYVERGYVLRDPIVRRLQTQHTPFTWREAFDACQAIEDAKLIGGEASEFGLREGVVVPVPLLGRASLAFSFGGAAMDCDPVSLSNLTFVTNFAAGRLLNLLRLRSEQKAPQLTRRETECLKWAAAGKKDDEIADLINVSRYTVIKHLVSAREKLGAANKFHAIAIALRMKIIA